MRTKHAYICELCGKEQPKDWRCRGENDDSPAICRPCFNEETRLQAEFDIWWAKRNERLRILAVALEQTHDGTDFCSELNDTIIAMFKGGEIDFRFSAGELELVRLGTHTSKH
jgi:hypothetical protein